MTRRGLPAIYRRLLHQHGPQAWWPGETVFEVMVGAVLTQNNAWTNVERALARLKQAHCLSAAAILACPPRRLAALIRPAGYFNIKARRLKHFCVWYRDNGEVRRLRYWPTARLRAGLLSVNGVGAETADDILLYAFNRPVFIVDAYTRRLFARLGEIAGTEAYEEIRARFERRLAADTALYKEYHALIVMHGKHLCRPQPRCEACALARRCPTAPS
jgi:endonuclease-3 related protein